MKITRCAGHRRKRQNKDDVERETRKGRTEENRRPKGPLCGTGRKDSTTNDIEGWYPRERASLGSGGTRKKGICDIFREKIMEHVIWTFQWVTKKEEMDLVEGQTPSETEEETALA
jgi:hypothetical protein